MRFSVELTGMTFVARSFPDSLTYTSISSVVKSSGSVSLDLSKLWFWYGWPVHVSTGNSTEVAEYSPKMWDIVASTTKKPDVSDSKNIVYCGWTVTYSKGFDWGVGNWNWPPGSNDELLLIFSQSLRQYHMHLPAHIPFSTPCRDVWRCIESIGMFTAWGSSHSGGSPGPKIAHFRLI